MISVSVFDKESYRHSQSHDLRCGNSQPYAVYSQDKGEYQHRYHLEKQRSQERYGCGDRSVSKGCEQRGSIYVEAAEQERQGIKPETVACHLVKLLVIAYKNFCQSACHEDRKQRYDDSCRRKYFQAGGKEIFQLAVILCAVVI